MSKQQQEQDGVPYTFGNEVEVKHGPDSDLAERIAHLEWQVRYLQREHTQQTLERRANDLTQQVAEFHRAFGYPVRDRITEPTANEVALRLRLVSEEFLEFFEAHGAGKTFCRSIESLVHSWIEWQRSGPGFSVDHVAAADAMADLDYVIQGTRLTYGIPRQAVANEVHTSNMAKAGAGHDARGKLQKPKDWTPPDIAGVIARFR